MSASLLLAHGDDSFGLDQVLRAFAERIGADDRVEIVALGSPDEGAIERAALEAGMVGMFGTHLAVLRQPLRAAGRSTTATERLLALVRDLPDGAALALVDLRASRDATKPPALIGKLESAVVTRGGLVEQRNAPRRAELQAWVRRHAEAIIPLRAHHPSLAIWCGGNELEGPDGPLDDDAPVLGALREVVARLDPDRAWLPTSPSGPRFHTRLDVIEADPDGLHDVHGPWEHQGLAEQHALANATSSLLHSEFGVEGMTNRAAHEALIDEERRWPADRSNPVYEHLGAWGNTAPLVQELTGGRLADLAPLINPFNAADGTRALLVGDLNPESSVAGSDLDLWVYGLETLAITGIAAGAIVFRYRRVAA